MNTPLPELQPLPDAERRHVAVVGAGLVGLCTALWLQRMGHRVMIIDPAPPFGDASYRQACSYGNACTFAPHGVVPVATPGVIWRVPGMLLNPLGPLAIVWRYLPQLIPWLRAFLASSTKAEVERIAGTLAVLLSHADAAWQPLVMQAGAERLKRHDGCLYLYKSEAQFRAADAENGLRE
ncbi:FAD-dependent oxidoreductase, partial [Rhizobium leguminosarum]